MSMKMSYRNSCLGCLLVVSLAILVIAGCSQKVVNEDPAPSIALSMKVTEPALIELVSQFRLIVTGPDMDRIDTSLALQDGYLVGRIEVPAGDDRHFTALALDETDRIIYRGDTVINVRAGTTIELTMYLYPQVPLIKLSPRYQQVNINSPFFVDVKVYEIDSLYGITFRVYYEGLLVNPDSAKPADTRWYLSDSINTDSNFYEIYVSAGDQVNPIVDDSGNATLARVYFTSGYGIEIATTTELIVEPTYLFGPRDTIPVNSIYSDRSLVEILPSEEVFFPDSLLEQVIRDKIGEQERPIFLSDVEPIDTLYAEEVGIQDLTGLSNLTNLVYLNLDYNLQISDISELSGLTKIEMLFLQGNNINNIGPLSGLINLKWLDLSYNQISDIRPLVLNEGMGAGDVVFLTGNPLSATSVSEYIPVLEARGVTVFFEEY